MSAATFAIPGFLGGEISQFWQGRFDRPDYKISLNVSLNGFPVEAGAWVRRPGTAHAGMSRGGAKGRTLKFDFSQAVPYTVEYTDGFLRFRSGLTIATNNDAQAVSAISTANPAVVTVTTSPSTGATVVFSNNAPALLQNRQFTWTNISGTTGSIADALTGTGIDGSTLGTLGIGVTMSSIQEVASPYAGGVWSTLRMVQAQETSICLQASVAPQALTVTTDPTATSSAIFALNPAVFNDGPYLDPFTNGVLATPNGKTGIVQLTLSFPLWDPTVSYANGAFVTAGSTNYESQIDQNIGAPISVTFTGGSAQINATNTYAANNQVIFFDSGGTLPAALTAGTVYFVISTGLSSAHFEVSATQGGSAITMATAGTGTMTVALAPGSSPSAWSAVNASAAVNPPTNQPNGTGRGFLQTDIGRQVRLLSEPPLWTFGGVYSAGTVVTYNPTGQGPTYWQSLTSSNTGNIPGNDITNWQLVAPGSSLPSIAGVTASPAAAAGPAQWTWGKIVSLVNFIAGNVSGVAQIGNMTGGGGRAAGFDGNTDKVAAASPELSQSFTNAGALNGYVGQNYSGTSATEYAVQSVTIFPTTDEGLARFSTDAFEPWTAALTAYLYASNSAPSTYNNGVLLGSTVIASNVVFSSGNPATLGTSAASITSSDKVTQYAYWWIVLAATAEGSAGGAATVSVQTAQIELIQAGGTGSGNAINVELIGPPLLYTSSIRTWRLGTYSGTTGYPTCGCYAGGRLWLGGAIANRFDASVSGGVNGGTLNFAPTDQYGGVNDNSAIDYTLDAEGQNQIQWMRPIVQNQALRGIVMGTLVAEQFIFAPGNGALSPINIDDIPATHIGSANVLPVQTEHTVIFVQRYSVKMMEYFSDVFSGKFTAPNLADKAQHITRAGIAELAYTHSANPIIWGRDNNGALFGLTYKRDTLMTSSGPTFYAWHRHALGSGRIVESLCQGPSVGGTLDALTMVTNDTNSNVRHVEVLTDVLDELSTPAQAAYLDDAITPTSSSSTSAPSGGAPYGGLTLNGLWPHNGKTVTAWLGGLDCGDYTVTSGSITVPYGDGIGGNKGAGTANGLFTANFVSTGITANGNTMFTGAMPMVVGFTYNSDGQIVRRIDQPESGARNGPALGKLRRNHYLIPLVQGISGAGGLSSNYPLLLGTQFDSTFKPALFKIPNTGTVGIDAQFSGVYRDQFTSDYDYDGMACWRVTRPYICNIPALGSALETQDV